MNMTWTVARKTAGLVNGAVMGGKWLLALGLALTAMAASATDDPPGRVGRVGDTRGQVWTLEAGQGEWLTLQRNRPITTGDRITTDNNARAELQVGSTTFRLGEHTDVQVMRLDDERIQLQLAEGSLTVRVREPELVGEVEVLTDEGRFTPRAVGFYRVDNSTRDSKAEAVMGELLFEGRDSGLAIRNGQRAEFWLDNADRAMHYSWAQPANDELQQWARDEDVRHDRRADSRYVSPEMTGAEDLDRYGQWSNHPEYGAIWAPQVDPGWAPYRYGQWAWVSPWGWTWVDDSPWGFAPFHYGRWVFFSGRWCWSPGHRERRPVYSPALVAWVGGNGFNASLRVGGGPGVGWIPLAPREAYRPWYNSSPTYIQNINRNHVLLPREPQRGQHPPVSYTNRGVPGGITVVPAQALQQRQPVAVAPQRAPDEVVQRGWRGDRGTPISTMAPPTPQGVQLSPRVVPAPGQMREVPRPGAATGRYDERGQRGHQGGDPRPGVMQRIEVSPAVMPAQRPQPQQPAGQWPAQGHQMQPQQQQQPQQPTQPPSGWRSQNNPAVGNDGMPNRNEPGVQRQPMPAPAAQDAPRGYTPREVSQQRAPAMEPRPQQMEPPQRGERRMAAPVVEQRQPQMQQPPQVQQAPQRQAPQAQPSSLQPRKHLLSVSRTTAEAARATGAT